MPSEAEVIACLRREFAADAAIVVGSRADGTAHEHSDWDIYVLIDDGAGPSGPKPAPRTLAGAHLDTGVVHTPIPNDAIIRTFGANLQEARVLFDTPAAVARGLMDSAQAIYARGREISAQERAEHAARFARNIATMKGRRLEAGAFFEALAFVFYASHRLWYELKRRRWSRSVHRAMPEIAAEDPVFHADLLILATHASIDEQIAAAERLQTSLFGGRP